VHARRHLPPDGRGLRQAGPGTREMAEGRRRVSKAAAKPAAAKSPERAPHHQRTALALQGGGALGAYQAGVYQALSEAGYALDWIAGVSIGAINAALIAGNPPKRRLERLESFWQRISSNAGWVEPQIPVPMRESFAEWSSTLTTVVGRPGFFEPR